MKRNSIRFCFLLLLWSVQNELIKISIFRNVETEPVLLMAFNANQIPHCSWMGTNLDHRTTLMRNPSDENIHFPQVLAHVSFMGSTMVPDDQT